MAGLSSNHGYGDGSGSGSGSGGGGDGYGYGDGSGSGSGGGGGDGGDGGGGGGGGGSAIASGYGGYDGSGCGCGGGDGGGSDDGDGSGCGISYEGYGDGYCGSDNTYWKSVLADCAIPAAVAARRMGACLAIWRSDGMGCPANGGGGETPVYPGLMQVSQGPLRLCDEGTLHASLCPEKWYGNRLWLVALHGKVIGTEEKMGALRREIIAEIAPCEEQ